jgi:hypothetical protein
MEIREVIPSQTNFFMVGLRREVLKPCLSCSEERPASAGLLFLSDRCGPMA